MKVLATCIALSAFAARLSATAPDTWTVTGSLTTPRTTHTATLLLSGQVLAAGGWSATGCATNTSETYDPAAGAWTAAGNMQTARDGHVAALLPGGQVLVAGGCNGPTV